jgi:hypothetical protein
MEAYIAILLLIVPGFIARYFFEKLNDNYTNEDKFQVTISALIYSIFIILINYLIIRLLRIIDTNSLEDISENFLSLNFVIFYTLLTLPISLYVGYLWNELFPLFMGLINKIRDIKGKNGCGLDPSVCASYLNDGKDHLVTIKKNGTPIGRGFVDRFSRSNDLIKEISLSNQDTTKTIKEIDDLPIKITCYNFEKDIEIVDHNIDSYLDTKESKGKSLFIFFCVTIGYIGWIYGCGILYRVLLNSQ